MRRLKFTAAVLAALFALSTATATAGAPVLPPITHHHHSTNATAVWIIFGCAGSIVLAALAANYQQHRQLTAAEAGTCGLGFWFTPPPR
jgi:ABC-type siderophore export system fused ATPase/permease subunit